jgi:hypothetical protein
MGDPMFVDTARTPYQNYYQGQGVPIRWTLLINIFNDLLLLYWDKPNNKIFNVKYTWVKEMIADFRKDILCCNK